MMDFGIHSLISGMNILIGLCSVLVIYGFWRITRIISSFNTFDFDRDDMLKIYQDYKNDVREMNRLPFSGAMFCHDSEFGVDESQLVFQEIPVDRRTLH